VGDTKSSLGDAKSSLGDDAKSPLGDAKSSLGDAKSSLGDAKSSLGVAKSSLGDDAKSPLGDVQVHTDKVQALLLSKDGSTLWSAAADKTIVQWDVKTLTIVRTLKGHTGGTRHPTAPSHSTLTVERERERERESGAALRHPKAPNGVASSHQQGAV
jgi:WD40 repeat protein